MAPATITLLKNIALGDAATNDDTSTVGEPSVAVADRQIFVTGNWYASRSIDDGASWTHIDPFATLPSAAGGFCCDQLTLHDHGRGVWIWILQYIQQNGTNIFRLAATRDADFPIGGWYWWDIAPATLDATWTNVWFDYPDAAMTADNLFITFNMFDAANNWRRAAVMRFPLATIANAGTLIFNSWSTTNNGSLRLTQGAQGTMYWGSHNSTNQVRLFAWADGQNAINWWDVGVGQWSQTITSTAPNGVDWLARADPRITGASVGNGIITFMWTGGSRQNRPHPYCRAVRIREATKQVIDEPDLYSNSRAYAYPAVATNNAAVIGVTAFYGGADRNPGHIVGARDDAGGIWAVAYSQLGSHAPDPGRWGDYLNCRAHHPNMDTWVASGYTLEGGTTRQDIVPRVVHFRLDSGPLGASPRVPGKAQTSGVSRSADKLDIFVTAANGVIWTAAWEPAFTDWWHGWWEVTGGRSAPGAPIHVASRSQDKLDVFVVGADNHVYTAAWEPAFTDGWHGWWELRGGVAAAGAHVTVVSRSRDKLDVFVVGTDNRVYTAAWEPAFTDWWHGWWPIGDIRVPAGAPVHAVSRSTDKLDIFVTDVNGVIQTAAWEPAFTDGWHGWWELRGGRAAPGAPVYPVSRSQDKLDVFVVGTDNRVYTAAWEPAFTDWWHGWWPIGA